MAGPSDKALNEFLSEGQEIVETFNRNLLGFDSQRNAGQPIDPDLINESFRAVHSLKGLVGLFGLGQTGELAHSLETLLDQIRLGKHEVGPETMDVLFEAVELFGQALAAAATGGDLEPSVVAEYLGRLRGASEPEPDLAGGDDAFGGYQFPPSLLSVLTEYEEHRLRENIRTGAMIYRVSGQFDLMTIDKGIEEIKQRSKPVGEIVTYLPSGDSSDPNTLELQILIASRSPIAALREALQGIDVDIEEVARVLSPPPAPKPPSSIATTDTLPAGQPVPASVAVAPADPDLEAVTTLRSVSQTVRVDIRKLDALMNAVGELGIVHAGLERLLAGMVDKNMADESRALRSELRALERKLAELQGGILEVRMVPLRQVFDKLSRVVRKVSRSIGKQIRLEISGGETELDKLIVEELSDPLMHIIRNAIDHGIESAEERIAAAKPEIGTVSVSALQQGNRVMVIVSDDGRGIDEDRIAQVAVERGVVDDADLREMTRRDRLNLMFLPGMSTRAEATELSGRGVGLDVVKTNIAHLSGIIDVSSTAGRGTQWTITLPITLAIIQAIIVKVAGRTYAVPLNSVVESLMVEPSEIQTVEGREVVSLRNHTLRLARVSDMFRLKSDAAAQTESADVLLEGSTDIMYVIVVGVAQHRLGLVVDELVGQQDIVIKSLGRALSGLPGIAGATELGGQRTVLVLDVPGLVEEVLQRGNTKEVAA